VTDALSMLFQEWTQHENSVSSDAVAPSFRRFQGQFELRILEELRRSLGPEQLESKPLRGGPDLVASSSQGVLAIEIKFWDRLKKNIGNRTAEAVEIAVRDRRLQPDEVWLTLLVVVPPARSAGDLTDDELLMRATRTLRGGDGVGFDRVLLGFAEAVPRWFVLRPGDTPRIAPDSRAAYRDALLVGHLPGAVKTHRVLPQLEPRILLVGDEWAPSHGGLSSFNRQMAVALAANGFKTSILVPEATPEERDEASALNVTLVAAAKVPGIVGKSALMLPLLLDGGAQPDVIVGHGRTLGPYAMALQKTQFREALRLHIVHTDAEELEASKEAVAGRSHLALTDERRELELQLAASAELVGGVGPLLSASIEDQLRGEANPPPVLEIVPGLREWGAVVETVPNGVQVLVSGRAEDFRTKGFDIAAQVFAKAIADPLVAADLDPVLVVRGVNDQEADHVKAQLNEAAPSDRYRLRGYSTEEAKLKSDLWGASVLLMPSLHEGFGLSAYDAIAAGVPVLVTARSGVGRLLLRIDPEAPEVIAPRSSREETVRKWAEALVRVLADRPAAFSRARELREVVAAAYTWSMVADQIRL
jgi:D-inositol-3-phosphate glycosyltransferase